MSNNYDFDKEIEKLNKNNSLNNIPEPCKKCSNHPSNGGSGICQCTLGLPTIS